MHIPIQWTSLDTWIVVTGAISAMSCALIGNFMILRRLSMMGDAISHAVLPGLAVAFLISGSRDSMTMFLGAAVVGIFTAWLTESIHQLGKVEESASMGVVFTTLFAIGLVMLVRAADSVDLDPGCVLYGAIELTPLDTKTFLGQDIPRAALTTGAVLILNVVVVTLLYKEFKVSAFDPALSTTIGINARLMHYVLMSLVAITAVAAFEAVGSILVIAMLIVPGATAYLLCDRLINMVLVSMLIAALSAVLGHLAAITVPTIWGFADTSTAGMIAVMSGLLFLVIMVMAPRHGILSKLARQWRLAVKITSEDILGLHYRFEEIQRTDGGLVVQEVLRRYSGTGALLYHTALFWLRQTGKLAVREGRYRLTDRGKDVARSLIRSHRLWESYLYKYVDLPIHHLHFSAEQLEHVTGPDMQQRLASTIDSPVVDPHGKSIPSPSSD